MKHFKILLFMIPAFLFFNYLSGMNMVLSSSGDVESCRQECESARTMCLKECKHPFGPARKACMAGCNEAYRNCLEQCMGD